MREQESTIKELILEGKLNEAITEAGENVSSLFVALNLLFQKRKPKEGLIVAKKILKLDPQNVDAHEICGRMLVKCKRYSDAESEFYEALKSKDKIKSSEIRTYLANMLKKIELLKMLRTNTKRQLVIIQKIFKHEKIEGIYYLN